MQSELAEPAGAGKKGAAPGAMPGEAKRGRPPAQVNLVRLRTLFGMPQPQAAEALGVSLTTLKQVCRRLGLSRWPYRRTCKHGKNEKGGSALTGTIGSLVKDAASAPAVRHTAQLLPTGSMQNTPAATLHHPGITAPFHSLPMPAAYNSYGPHVPAEWAAPFRHSRPSEPIGTGDSRYTGSVNQPGCASMQDFMHHEVSRGYNGDGLRLYEMQETALWNSIRANTSQGPAHGQPQVQLPFRQHYLLPYAEPMGIGGKPPGASGDPRGLGGEQNGIFGPKSTPFQAIRKNSNLSPRPINSVASAVAHATSLIAQGAKEKEVEMERKESGSNDGMLLGHALWQPGTCIEDSRCAGNGGGAPLALPQRLM